MPTYKILDDNNIAINTIIADEEFVAAAYPGKYELCVEPEVSLSDSTPDEHYITGVEFLRRFTLEQRISIRDLAKVDSILNDFLYLLDATISAGGNVNLNDPDTIAGVNYIASQLAAININIVPEYILRKE